jgi:hypothetical protein
MKEHNVSQSTVPPTSVKITYNSTVDELLTDWLAERVQQGIDIVIDEAMKHYVPLKEIWVAGHESPEEPTREIWVTAETDASHEVAYELLGVLAPAFYHLNETPPKGVENADVTVQIAVNW